MITVCTSGYFNPLHKGHVRLLEKAKKLGDYLIVIVNNDLQVGLKGSKPFMNEAERCEIIRAVGCVNEVVLSIDTDRTVCKTLKMVCPNVFAKGGDSVSDNVPERAVCEEIGARLVFDVGGGKIQSSSSLKNAL